MATKPGADAHCTTKGYPFWHGNAGQDKSEEFSTDKGYVQRYITVGGSAGLSFAYSFNLTKIVGKMDINLRFVIGLAHQKVGLGGVIGASKASNTAYNAYSLNLGESYGFKAAGKLNVLSGQFNTA